MSGGGGGETNLSDISLLQNIQNFYDVLVLDFAVATHHDTEIRVFSSQLNQELQQCAEVDLSHVEINFSIRINRHVIWLFRSVLGTGTGTGQIEFQIIDHWSCGDDEDHEQHEREIKQGRDVEFVE